MLKKKLYQITFSEFFHLYKYGLIYQCHIPHHATKVTNLYKNADFVLFLMKNRRSRKLINIKEKVFEKQINDNIIPCSNMANTVLVGCSSLEAMQRCVLYCDNFKKGSFFCLGGIYEDKYLNASDCKRLSLLDPLSLQISTLESLKAVNLKLISVLKASTNLTLHLINQKRKKLLDSQFNCD